MSKRIVVEFTDGHQRNKQIGDYGETEKEIWFKITQFPQHPAYSFACLIHELWEKFRNNQLGITDEMVDLFDEANQDADDPGMLLAAPYHKIHCESDVLERMCIQMSGEDWAEYELAIKKLFNSE